MTLPAPVLDDLTWADMMAAIRRRIPAESDGVWTLHAPVDPGITLLELFAYLLEQRLYWLDQVPDALVVAILRLLGIDPPRPARPAATVLGLTAQWPGTPVPVVPAGTVMSRDPAARITFTLDDDVAVFPLDGEVTVWTDRDHTADLRARRGVSLLASDGRAASARFTLPLTGEYPAPGWLSLLFELDTPAAIAPSWSLRAVPGGGQFAGSAGGRFAGSAGGERLAGSAGGERLAGSAGGERLAGSGGVDPPAELTWSWFRPDFPVDARPFVEVVDGTGGLRRSGVVRLRPPEEWTTEARGLMVSTLAATFAAPPRLLRLAVNVAAARHRERRTVTGTELADQTAAWLKLPGQRIVLPDAAGRLLDATLRLAGEQWAPVVDFAFGASRDRIFVLDRAEGALVFGDGLTGRVPRPTGDVRVEYHIGGGRDGNGGLTENWLPVEDSVARRGVLVAANLVQAEDGADPETVAQARARAAGALGEVTRAVTAEDFVTLATTTPGVAVARAYASLGEHPGFPCTPVPGAVTVHIVPAVPRDGFGGDFGGGTGFDQARVRRADLGVGGADLGQVGVGRVGLGVSQADFGRVGVGRADFVPAPRPDPGMICAVAGRLAQARLLTSEVFVRAPAYRAVSVRVDLSGSPADRARVSAAVDLALRRYLDPLVGGDEGTGWPFGEPLRPSALLRAAQRALGDLADIAAVAIGLDGEGATEACRDAPLRPGELPVVRQIRTRIVPTVEPGEGLA